MYPHIAPLSYNGIKQSVDFNFFLGVVLLVLLVLLLCCNVIGFIGFLCPGNGLSNKRRLCFSSNIIFLSITLKRSMRASKSNS